MPHSIRAQNANIKPVFFPHNLMIPHGEVNIEIKPGEDILTTINKSSAHGFSFPVWMCIFSLYFFPDAVLFLSTRQDRTNLYKKQEATAPSRAGIKFFLLKKIPFFSANSRTLFSSTEGKEHICRNLEAPQPHALFLINDFPDGVHRQAIFSSQVIPT
mgnify:FL=1